MCECISLLTAHSLKYLFSDLDKMCFYIQFWNHTSGYFFFQMKIYIIRKHSEVLKLTCLFSAYRRVVNDFLWESKKNLSNQCVWILLPQTKDEVDMTENTLLPQDIDSKFNSLIASWPNNRHKESTNFILHSGNV